MKKRNERLYIEHLGKPGFLTPNSTMRVIWKVLMQDLALMSDFKLSEDELKDLTPPSEEKSSGLFCQQCGECLPQCRNDLDIPTYMRSYMYAYGHKNPAHARASMLNADLSDALCNNCKSSKQVGLN